MVAWDHAPSAGPWFVLRGPDSALRALIWPADPDWSRGTLVCPTRLWFVPWGPDWCRVESLSVPKGPYSSRRSLAHLAGPRFVLRSSDSSRGPDPFPAVVIRPSGPDPSTGPWSIPGALIHSWGPDPSRGPDPSTGPWFILWCPYPSCRARIRPVDPWFVLPGRDLSRWPWFLLQGHVPRALIRLAGPDPSPGPRFVLLSPDLSCGALIRLASRWKMTENLPQIRSIFCHSPNGSMGPVLGKGATDMPPGALPVGAWPGCPPPATATDRHATTCHAIASYSDALPSYRIKTASTSWNY